MTAWKRWVGVGLIALAGVFFAGMLLVGFLPFSLKVRGGLGLACFILMEVSFWLGTLIIGKQAVKAWWQRWRSRSDRSSEASSEPVTESEPDPSPDDKSPQ